MLIVKGTVDNYGLDFITLTKTTGDTARTSIERVWDEIAPCIDPLRIRWGGYEGFREGPLRIGRRTRDGNIDRILTVSGAASNDVLRANESDLRDLRCTRIDLQVTVRLDERNPDLAKEYFEHMKLQSSYKQAMVGRRNISLVDSLSGQTLYVGKRTSKTLMVRIYDKGAQAGGEPGFLWRFEIEYKSKLSTEVLSRILDSQNMADRVLSGIVDGLEGVCGVVIKSESDPLNLAPKEDGKEDVLGWIKKCVRPVVVSEVNQGRATEVIDALGLSWIVELSQVEQRMIEDQVRERVKALTGAMVGS